MLKEIEKTLRLNISQDAKIDNIIWELVSNEITLSRIFSAISLKNKLLNDQYNDSRHLLSKVDVVLRTELEFYTTDDLKAELAEYFKYNKHSFDGNA